MKKIRELGRRICKLEGYLLPTRYTNCVVSQAYISRDTRAGIKRTVTSIRFKLRATYVLINAVIYGIYVCVRTRGSSSAWHSRFNGARKKRRS